MESAELIINVEWTKNVQVMAHVLDVQTSLIAEGALLMINVEET